MPGGGGGGGGVGMEEWWVADPNITGGGGGGVGIAALAEFGTGGGGGAGGGGICVFTSYTMGFRSCVFFVGDFEYADLTENNDFIEDFDEGDFRGDFTIVEES